MPGSGGCSSSGDPSLAESLGTTELGLVSRVATVRAHDGLSVSTGVFSMPRLSTEIAPDLSIAIVTSSGIEIPSTPPTSILIGVQTHRWATGRSMVAIPWSRSKADVLQELFQASVV